MPVTQWMPSFRPSRMEMNKMDNNSVPVEAAMFDMGDVCEALADKAKAYNQLHALRRQLAGLEEQINEAAKDLEQKDKLFHQAYGSFFHTTPGEKLDPLPQTCIL